MFIMYVKLQQPISHSQKLQRLTFSESLKIILELFQKSLYQKRQNVL